MQLKLLITLDNQIGTVAYNSVFTFIVIETWYLNYCSKIHLLIFAK